MARKDSITIAIEKLTTVEVLNLSEVMADIARRGESGTVAERVGLIDDLSRVALLKAFTGESPKPKRKPKNGSIPPQEVGKVIPVAHPGVVALPGIPVQPFIPKDLSDARD